MNLRKKKHLAKEGVGGRGGTTKQKKKHENTTKSLLHFNFAVPTKRRQATDMKKGETYRAVPVKYLLCAISMVHILQQKLRILLMRLSQY
jgi:hypothetical protein